MIKEIKVENCRECPFVIHDCHLGYWACNLSDDVKGGMWDQLPEDKVHDLCPLKTDEFKVYLKND